MAKQKITNFIIGSMFSSKVQRLVVGLVRALVNSHPVEILKCLLPQIFKSIVKILDESEIALLSDYKGDLELTWNLVLFSELLQAPGDSLLIYQQLIKSTFDRCTRIIHKDSYRAIAAGIEHLLQSLLNIYPVDYTRSRNKLDEPFIDFLPIRASLSFFLCRSCISVDI